jgi:hypothetical protein
MQIQRAVRLLPVTKRMRLRLAAAMLEDGESLVAVSSAKTGAKHLCLILVALAGDSDKVLMIMLHKERKLRNGPISDRAGPNQRLEIACQASSSQPRLTAASLYPRQPSTSTHVNPSTSTVTLF